MSSARDIVVMSTRARQMISSTTLSSPRRASTRKLCNRLCLLSSLASLAALLVVAPLAVVTAAGTTNKATSVLDFHVKDIEGKDVDLASYKGKVLLIVNTASQCGLTPQYKDLEAMYES